MNNKLAPPAPNASTVLSSIAVNGRPLSLTIIDGTLLLEGSLVSTGFHWKDPLGLRQHTEFCQGHSASPIIT